MLGSAVEILECSRILRGLVAGWRGNSCEELIYIKRLATFLRLERARYVELVTLMLRGTARYLEAVLRHVMGQRTRVADRRDALPRAHCVAPKATYVAIARYRSNAS